MQKDESQRLNNTVIKPIVYGNVSRYLGKKREEDGRTHVWTAFIRPFDPNDDISAYVKRVQFKLHESYSNPIRTVIKPPFEVTETGWGEFDIAMKVFFVDPNMKPLTINHLIKLFHFDHEIMMGQKSLVREIYDEMVFVDPSPEMLHGLMRSTTSNRSKIPPVHHETDFAESNQQALEQIEELNKKVVEAIEAYRQQLILKKDIVEEVKVIADKVEASVIGSIP
nr:YEATS domain containing protein [Hymenolepis microstoma]